MPVDISPGTGQHLTGVQARGARLDSLTAVRGIAALMVVIYHAGWSWNGVFKLGQGTTAIFASAWMWVSFFFVLSGFVMMSAYGATLDTWKLRRYGTFVLTRFGRIYPLYLLTMAALWLFQGGSNAKTETLVPSLLLVQGFIYGRHVWNEPAWSISTEWYVYLAFPFFVPMLRRLGHVATCACTLAFCIAVAWLFIADTNATIYPIERLIGCGLQFATGCCVCRMVEQRWWPRIPSSSAASLLAILPVLLMALPIRFFTVQMSACVAVLFATSIGILAAQATFLDRPLRHPLPQFFGRISYSIYLNHAIGFLIAQSLADHWTGRSATLMALSKAGALLLFPLYLAVLIGVSTITYEWVEEPARKWFKTIAINRIGEPAPDPDREPA